MRCPFADGLFQVGRHVVIRQLAIGAFTHEFLRIGMVTSGDLTVSDAEMRRQTLSGNHSGLRYGAAFSFSTHPISE
ncbi:hypothetical protein RF05_26830 [Salmonella enterica subsp. enterica]|nr:hypothetical protein [Salmonella enterica subsp. enterica serovar Rissen]